jgi:hypothetical protein
MHFDSESVYLDRSQWDNESITRLEELTVKLANLHEAREECERRAPPLTMEQPIRRLSEAELQQKSVAYREWRRQTEIAEQAFRRGVAEMVPLNAQMGNNCILQLSLRVICLRNRKPDERSYVLYRGAVWCSDRDLNAEQWQTLADRYLDQQDAELASALGESKPGSSRERIAPEVRRAVWIRDKGKCARCDSRERLEYDHIVPLSRGGSNTERNIELLCENCNRSKSDRVE